MRDPLANLGDVTQVKKKTQIYTPLLCEEPLTEPLSRVTPVSFAVEEQLTTSSTTVRLPMFGLKSGRNQHLRFILV